MSIKDLQFYYICSDCAQKKGLIWPSGHVATWHSGKCPYCEDTTQLASILDWRDPGNPYHEPLEWD